MALTKLRILQILAAIATVVCSISAYMVPRLRQPFALISAGVGLAFIRWYLFKESAVVPFGRFGRLFQSRRGKRKAT